MPYLVDRADGVKGHYAIGRWNPRGYREVWNLHSHRWAAYSDDVMSLEEADSLLRQITIPTVRASLPAPQQATPEPWRPDVCPFTGLAFFMWIEHHKTGQMVPTYGGPYDSYTIPVRDTDGSYCRERYDHERGGWLLGEVEDVGVQIVSDQAYVSDEPPAAPAHPDWRDRLTVNLLRQGAGLTKKQIRAIIDHAVDGIEPDPALFPATPNLYIGACITDGRLHATVQRLESNGNVTLVATAEMDAALLHGRDCMAQMTTAKPEPVNVWTRALEIRMAQGWRLTGDRLPVLSTAAANMVVWRLAISPSSSAIRSACWRTVARAASRWAHSSRSSRLSRSCWLVIGLLPSPGRRRAPGRGTTLRPLQTRRSRWCLVPTSCSWRRRRGSARRS